MVGLKELFASLPTKSTIRVFNHGGAFGVVVGFSETDYGFGEITLVVDKTTGEARCDLEEMSPDHCGEILMRTVGTTVEDSNARE